MEQLDFEISWLQYSKYSITNLQNKIIKNKHGWYKQYNNFSSLFK